MNTFLFIFLVCFCLNGIACNQVNEVKQRIFQQLGYHDTADFYSRYDIVWPQHRYPGRHRRQLPSFSPGTVWIEMNLFGKDLATFLEPSNLTSAHFSSNPFSSLFQDVLAPQLDFQCHFRGFARLCDGKGVCEEGKTALSSCGEGGLRGFIQSGGDDVELEPLPKYLWQTNPEAFGGHLASKIPVVPSWDDFHSLMADSGSLNNINGFPSSWEFVKDAGLVYTFTDIQPLPSTAVAIFAADIDFDSDELLLEIGVFVDQPMTIQLKKEYPARADRINAVLSAINAVQVLYDDSSFGNVRIKISVKAVIFDDSGKLADFTDGEAETYLTQFCATGQDQLGVPADWDVTVILTGTDIYGVLTDIVADKAYAGLGLTDKKVYGVTGLSYTGGVCRPHKNCVLAEYWKEMANVDTIAHELGHILGMNHDGASNTCSSTAGKIMSLSSTKRRTGWSTCSIATMIQFLRQGNGACLTSTDD